jgi:hypothetical protein
MLSTKNYPSDRGNDEGPPGKQQCRNKRNRFLAATLLPRKTLIPGTTKDQALQYKGVAQCNRCPMIVCHRVGFVNAY